MFKNPDPRLTETKRTICSAAILAVLSNNSTNKANDMSVLQKFKHLIQEKFKNVTDLNGAKKALKQFFEKSQQPSCF